MLFMSFWWHNWSGWPIWQRYKMKPFHRLKSVWIHSIAKTHQIKMKVKVSAENNQSIQVLSRCRPILKWLNLYNPNGVKIGEIKMPEWLVTLIIISIILDTVILYCLNCFDYKFNLDVVSGTFPYVIGSTQITLVYLSLAMRKNIIVDAIDCLQVAVTKSWYQFLKWMKFLNLIASNIKFQDLKFPSIHAICSGNMKISK